VERNRKAGQNPPKVVAPIEEEEEECYTLLYTLLKNVELNVNMIKNSK